MKLVNDTIERFKKQKLIIGKVTEGLKSDPETPKYTTEDDPEGDPGCLVVSSVNCCTTNISKYVQIPRYVKDTQDFLKKLK